MYIKGSKINTVGHIPLFLKVHLNWLLLVRERNGCWSSHGLLGTSLFSLDSARCLGYFIHWGNIDCINGVSSTVSEKDRQGRGCIVSSNGL